MTLSKEVLLLVVSIILHVKLSSAIKYKFIIETEEVFASCPNQPSNVLGLQGLLNDSETTLMASSNKSQVSGNLTFIWYNEPTDRIQIFLALHRFDRGSWQPTPFSISVYNVCDTFYDKEQYWYKHWTKHVINQEEVKNKCFAPGTKLVHEPFDLDITTEFTGPPLNGQYKIVATFTAFDKNNVKREESVCLEIHGEFIRA